MKNHYHLKPLASFPMLPDTLPKIVSADALPRLADGFTLRLHSGDWGALFPRYHLMWISPKVARAREFVKAGPFGYDAFLSQPMKDSFKAYYIQPEEQKEEANPLARGELLDSTICFLPTNDCGLGCKYCFSGAVPKQFGAIPWTIAKAAVDLGVRNGVLDRMISGSGQLAIRFFGGGEPTEYWERFAQIIEYARERADANNLDTLVATMTNGQVAEEHYEWFLKNIDEVCISMDGPKDIQDQQRPTFEGEGSFDKSWKFVKAMDALGMEIKALRVTVTADTVDRMEEIARFFWDNLSQPYPIQFEPVYLSEVGRRNTVMPKGLDFVEQFRRVEDLALRRNAVVGTATRPLTIRRTAYCDSLEGRGLFVTPNGDLSLCSEVSAPNDPRKDRYYVGKYDLAEKRFNISKEGAAQVRCGTPWWCNGCFAQFSCKGGCEPRSQNEDTFVRKTWCQMVRGNLKWTWSDVRSGRQPSRARIGDPKGEELIWLPIWEVSTSME